MKDEAGAGDMTDLAFNHNRQTSVQAHKWVIFRWSFKLIMSCIMFIPMTGMYGASDLCA